MAAEMIIGIAILAIGMILFYFSSDIENLMISAIAAVIGIIFICVGLVILTPAVLWAYYLSPVIARV